MRGRSRIAALLITATSLLAVGGCGGPSGPKRVQVSGEIQVETESLPAGVIRFLPGDGNKGPAANTLVKDGRYSFTTTDGPQPGLYRVQIARTLPADGKFTAGSNTGSAPAPRVEWLVMVQVPDETSFKRNFRLSTKDPDIVTLE